MQALIQALIGEITDDAPLAAIFGAAPAVYLGEAPESAALPLIILRLGVGRISYDFSGDQMAQVPVDFQIIAADMNIALTSAQRVATLLNKATLTLSAGSLLACFRTAPIQPAMPGFNSLLKALYTAGVRLECQVFNAA